MSEDIEIIKKHYVFTTKHVLDDENKQFKQAIENLINKNKEQEKMIDLMAQYIDFDKMDFNCSNLCVHDGCIEECVIKYFKKQAKELI